MMPHLTTAPLNDEFSDPNCDPKDYLYFPIVFLLNKSAERNFPCKEWIVAVTNRLSPRTGWDATVRIVKESLQIVLSGKLPFGIAKEDNLCCMCVQVNAPLTEGW